jgi:putative Mn2+ efflux pump MntP
LGHGKLWYGLFYGLVIGIIFITSTVVKSLGIELFGVNFKNGYEFAGTVVVIIFGVTLLFFLKKWNTGIKNI